jgi:CheY-like chemotaxis protein
MARSDRENHFAAFSKLRRQRIGDLFGGSGDHDAVKRRQIRRAGHAVADADPDIRIAEAFKFFARRIRQRAVAFDCNHFPRKPRQNGSLVTGTRSDFEHAILRTDFQLLGHVGDDKRLTDRLSASDRQGLVGVGGLDETRRDEIFPRHFLHRAKHRLVADPAPSQRKLKFHALDVVDSWFCGHGYLALLPYCRHFLPLRKACYTATYTITPAAACLDAKPRSKIFKQIKCSDRYGTKRRAGRYGASTGSQRMNHGKAAAGKRVLIVEDELMIRMLLEGMLTDLGHRVAAEAGGLDEAISLAKQGEFDLAVLDVNLNGNSVTPVVEILVERGVPFIFASGYGQRGLPEAYRTAPILQKPFQADALEQAIQSIANAGR